MLKRYRLLSIALAALVSLIAAPLGGCQPEDVLTAEGRHNTFVAVVDAALPAVGAEARTLRFAALAARTAEIRAEGSPRRAQGLAVAFLADIDELAALAVSGDEAGFETVITLAGDGLGLEYLKARGIAATSFIAAVATGNGTWTEIVSVDTLFRGSELAVAALTLRANVSALDRGSGGRLDALLDPYRTRLRELSSAG